MRRTAWRSGRRILLAAATAAEKDEEEEEKRSEEKEEEETSEEEKEKRSEATQLSRRLTKLLTSRTCRTRTRIVERPKVRKRSKHGIAVVRQSSLGKGDDEGEKEREVEEREVEEDEVGQREVGSSRDTILNSASKSNTQEIGSAGDWCNALRKAITDFFKDMTPDS
mmetsp:Transcript_6403/g.12462  ORF Transcript_6403/g.12462 Transcript_6403/m.12462 type:complete len:167 (+) Transcript_6403:157-657(+)